MKNLGRALRCYAIVEGLTTTKLADEIGITPRSLTRIERGMDIEGTTVLKLVRWLLDPGTGDDATRKEPAPEGNHKVEAVA